MSRESIPERYAALRAVAQDCRLLALQYRQLTERRDGLALRLVDDGETWREVAEAAGFANPHIAQLKQRRQQAEPRPSARSN